jgi:uncharacterized surface protein with fasciclin (FAS1) repeats
MPPVDAAFAELVSALGNSTSGKLLSNATALERLVRYHIAHGVAVLSSVLQNGTQLGTAFSSAAPLLITKAPSSNVIVIAGAASTARLVDEPDIITCHGVMRAIDHVLLPFALNELLPLLAGPQQNKSANEPSIINSSSH